MNDFHLSGGIFFLLITQAVYPKLTRNQVYSGNTEKMSENNILHTLFKIAIPNLQKLSKDDVSNFKRCCTHASSSLKTCGNEAGSLLVNRFETEYSNCLYDMDKFVNKYIDVSNKKERWLVNALLDLIEEDTSIKDDALFYIDNNSPITKIKLLNEKTINLSAFLLGIFRYVLTEIHDNMVGKNTYEQMCTCDEIKNSKRIFVSNIGEKERPIEIKIVQIYENMERFIYNIEK